MDPRIFAANHWRHNHQTIERLIDALTLQSRYAKEQERRLRDEVRREAEARQHQEDADRDLDRGRRRRRTAA